ncbi:hypothetical protein CsSME_00042896 [Camellia sinensis var. sinensis]
MLRDETAAADALQREVTRKQQTAGHYILRSSPIIATTSETTTVTLPCSSIKTPSVSSEVERLHNVWPIQAILPLPGPIFSIPFLRPSIPASLSFGLTPYFPHLSFNFTQFAFPLSLAVPSSSEEIPAITSAPVMADSHREDTSSSPIPCPLSLPTSSPSSLDLLVAKTMETARNTLPPSPVHMQPFLPPTIVLSAPSMSTDEVDIFQARLASLFDMPSTIPPANNNNKPLVLADSLLKFFDSSPSIGRTFLPTLDLDSYLELLTSFSRIPFEALQRPIIKNGFLQCCKVVEQSRMTISSHLSQAAATIDFYINICHAAKAAEEKLLRDQNFVFQIHAEVSELKEPHSSVSQFRTQLLEKKAQLEEELSAVNQALDQTATKP